MITIFEAEETHVTLLWNAIWFGILITTLTGIWAVENEDFLFQAMLFSFHKVDLGLPLR